MKIPKGHQVVMPYLMIKGASEFREFAIKVFNAQESFIRKNANNLIEHAELQIGGSTILYTESTELWKPQTANLFIYVLNADETYRIALDNGATTVMAPADQDYGRSCGIADPFGNIWWITSV